MAYVKRWIDGNFLLVDADTNAPVFRYIGDGQPMGELEILQALGWPIEKASGALIIKFVNPPSGGGGDVAAETARAEAAEAAIQGNLNTEVTRAEAAEAAAQAAAISTAASDATTKADAAQAAAISTAGAYTDGETTRAEAAEAAILDNVAKHVGLRYTYDPAHTSPVIAGNIYCDSNTIGAIAVVEISLTDLDGFDHSVMYSNLFNGAGVLVYGGAILRISNLDRTKVGYYQILTTGMTTELVFYVQYLTGTPAAVLANETIIFELFALFPWDSVARTAASAAQSAAGTAQSTADSATTAAATAQSTADGAQSAADAAYTLANSKADSATVTGISGNLDSEISRAEAAESALSDRITALGG